MNNSTPIEQARDEKKRIIVVLGMHRSGTSLLTNLLHILGMEVGSDLLPADNSNQLGYWENEKIYRTQDALLNHIAKDWGELGSVYPFAIDWQQLPQWRDYQDQLTSIVRAEMASAKGIWGFKDPRTCRLLPLWKQIFAEIGLEPLYVLAVRNPAAVAESLLKRNALDPLHSELVWLLHNLDAIRDAGEELRVVVDYDRWFAAPREQARAVAAALELPWPDDDTDLVEQITGAIRADLRRSKPPRPCSLPFVRKIYQALQEAAATGQSPAEVMGGGLELAMECVGAALELSAGSAHLALALGHAEGQVGHHEAALASYMRAVRLHPRLASAHASQGQALLQLGRSAEALLSAQTALSLDPNDAVALMVQARIDFDGGRLDAAEKSCRLLLEQNAGEPQAARMLEDVSQRKEKLQQSAKALFGSRATMVLAKPVIVPAPIRIRNGRIAKRQPAETTLASSSSDDIPRNGNGSSSGHSHAEPKQETGVCQDIGPGDEMFTGDRTHYFGVGKSALHSIQSAMDTVKKAGREIRQVLDLPCGHGRVMRFLEATFPQAQLTACDLNRGAVDFCARTFGAAPVYSHTDPSQILIEGKFDLVWCGSLLTHLRAEKCVELVRWFNAHLQPGGLLLFTLHGRWVERSLATARYRYGLPDERVCALLTDYYNSGFGYADYPGQKDYGITVCSPSYVLRELVAWPDLKLVSYHEKGWDNHQDVVCVQKQGPAELLG